MEEGAGFLELEQTVSGTDTDLRQKTPSLAGSFPKLFMISDCGREVSRFYRDNSWDLQFSDKLDGTCRQDRNDPPRFRVEATDASASETGPDTGTFTIYSNIVINTAVTLLLNLTGTARNGVDYITVSTTITFQVGESSKTITITPILDALTEGVETVTVNIVPTTGSDYYIDFTKTPVPNSDAFTVVSLGSATINISD